MDAIAKQGIGRNGTIKVDRGTRNAKPKLGTTWGAMLHRPPEEGRAWDGTSTVNFPSVGGMVEETSAKRADWGMAGECTSDHFPFLPVPLLSGPFEPTRTSQTLEKFFF